MSGAAASKHMRAAAAAVAAAAADAAADAADAAAASGRISGEEKGEKTGGDGEGGKAGLVVIAAWYGIHQTDKRWQVGDKVGIDVTDAVEAAVCGDEISLNEEAKTGYFNEFFKTDPSPWFRKVLAVRYRYGPKVSEIIADEAHAIFITQDPDLCSHEEYQACAPTRSTIIGSISSLLVLLLLLPSPVHY